jgi:RimJ/RimL family protein N-acetyltransferase
MLKGEKVTLRAVEKEDQESLWRFWNDLEVELAGGGDPPLPISLERIRSRFEREEREGARDNTGFMIEVDGATIGHCGLFHVDTAARHCELGIGIGEKDYWGRGYGREAVNLLLDYAFRIRNFRRVWLGPMRRTSARSGPTGLAGSWRRAGCANTSGSPAVTWTT